MVVPAVLVLVLSVVVMVVGNEIASFLRFLSKTRTVIENAANANSSAHMKIGR